MPQPSLIVAQAILPTITGNLPATELYTPAVDSLVVVSFYQILLTPATGTLAKVYLTWNDGVQLRGAAPDAFLTTWGNFGTLCLFVGAGKTLSLSTLNAAATDTQTIAYAVELVLPVSALPTYSVVSNFTLTSQTGDQVANAYTVPTDGVYRISFMTETANTAIGAFQVNWQAADGPHSQSINPGSGLTFPIHALANTSIQIICKANIAPPPMYNVYCTVEQLS